MHLYIIMYLKLLHFEFHSFVKSNLNIKIYFYLYHINYLCNI